MARLFLSAVLIAPLVLCPAEALAKRHGSADGGDSAPPPTPVITLTPGPGVRFQIPNNWIACEPDTEKLLSSADDAMNLRDKFCARSAAVPTTMRAFDPRPFHLLSVMFDYQAQAPLSEAGMADLKQADLDQARSVICDAEMKTLQLAPGFQTSCDVAIGTLAGHRAMVSTIVESKPGDSNATFTITSYEVAYPQGYVQIQFGVPELLRKLDQQEVNAIMDSIHIESAAPPSDTAPSSDAAQPDQAQPSPAAAAAPPATNGSI